MGNNGARKVQFLEKVTCSEERTTFRKKSLIFLGKVTFLRIMLFELHSVGGGDGWASRINAFGVSTALL